MPLALRISAYCISLSRRFQAAPSLVLVALCAVGCGDQKKNDSSSASAGAYDEFEAPQNVIIYLVDTLRASQLGCYGYERDTSPRIDAFSAEALLFEHCYSQSTWTKPSSASVLTGLYPSTHGMLSEAAVLPDAVKNIAEILSASTLKSAAFVASRYVFREQSKMLRGFDHPVAFTTPGILQFNKADRIVNTALEWIGEQKDEPFFVYMHTGDPHAPYGDSAPYNTKYVTPGASQLDGYFVLNSTREERQSLSEQDIQRQIDLYDGDVAYADVQFGRFLDGLTALGRDKDTMIVLVADHGEEFFEHGSWQHNPFMHPEVLGIPLIIRMPTGVRSRFSARRSDYCAQIDVLPTVLDALGIEAPEQLPGRSLLTPPTELARAPIFCETEGDASLKALIDGKYKYVRKWAPAELERLYDLDNDPDERRDLSKSMPELLAQYRKRLDEFVAITAGGYSLLIQNPSDDWLTVDVHIEARVPFTEVKLFYADTAGRHKKKRDGPARLTERDSIYSAKVRLNVKARNGDGVRFKLDEAAEQVRVSININGQLADPALTRLGPNAQIANEMPFILNLADAAELSAPRPAARGKFKDDPYRILLWSNMREEPKEAAITKDERAELSLIGYSGDDEEE